MNHHGAGIRIALFQPDIPGNTGAILRLAACLGMTVDIIEPAGFDMSDRALKRAGMDYIEIAALIRHPSWEVFEGWREREGRRAILFSTKAERAYTDFVHAAADARLLIPMKGGGRSLNLALAAAMAAGEAMRQVG